MKNRMLYCLLFISFMATASQAQNTQRLLSPAQAPVLHNPFTDFAGTNFTENSVLDTVLGSAFSESCGNSVTAVNSSGWGFISGMNDYGDLEKAQRLTIGPGTFNVQEVWGFFAYAAQVNNGALRAKVYSSTPNGSPATLIATSTDIAVSDIDDSGIVPTVFTFPSPVTVTGPEIFVSIDFSDLYATEDTVGLWMSQDGCGDGSDAYELWEDGISWYPFDDPSSWGAETNLLIGAVIDSDVSSTFSPLSMNGLQVYPAAPNPATDDIRISYYLADASKVQIQVYGVD